MTTTNIFQLAQIALRIKEYIDYKSDSVGSMPDISNLESVVKGVLTLDELNAWQNMKMNQMGMYVVMDNNTPIGIVICGAITSIAQSIIYIGPTGTPSGTSSTLSRPLNSGYSFQPGISIAVRFNVILGALFSGSGIKNGLSDWNVMTIATYKEGIQLGGGGKTWKGTKAEYDAIATKDPDTVYYIMK